MSEWISLTLNKIPEKFDTQEITDNESKIKMDKYDLAGFHLTEEIKKSLLKLGIEPQVLISITSEEKLLSVIAEEWNKEFKYEHKSVKKKTKNWEKKNFYD